MVADSSGARRGPAGGRSSPAEELDSLGATGDLGLGRRWSPRKGTRPLWVGGESARESRVVQGHVQSPCPAVAHHHVGRRVRARRPCTPSLGDRQHAGGEKAVHMASVASLAGWSPFEVAGLIGTSGHAQDPWRVGGLGLGKEHVASVVAVLSVTEAQDRHLRAFEQGCAEWEAYQTVPFNEQEMSLAGPNPMSACGPRPRCIRECGRFIVGLACAKLYCARQHRKCGPHHIVSMRQWRTLCSVPSDDFSQSVSPHAMGRWL